MYFLSINNNSYLHHFKNLLVKKQFKKIKLNF